MEEKRYIDADDAIYRLEKLSYGDSQPKAIRRAGKYLNAFANEQSADVEEVVRCKDCKYCDKIDDYDLLCRGHGMPCRLTTAEDFCSHGKRREAE